MRRSQLFVVGVVVVIAATVAAGLMLRSDLRCAGFAGGGVSPDELPPQPAPGAVRLAVWNIRNFPLDEREPDPRLGFSRRTNICDLHDALSGLDADLFGLAEITDTRRFPEILSRAGGEQRDYQAVFAPHGGRFGQKAGIAWDDRVLELVAEPRPLRSLVVTDGARPGISARLRLRSGGQDFTMISVHLEAGPGAWPWRRQQIAALADEIVTAIATGGDEDVLLVGDFNTAGWPGGDATAELAITDDLLAAAGLERLGLADRCTGYWQGPGGLDGVFEPTLVEHVYIRGLTGLSAGPARAWLHCARVGCEPLVSRPGAEDATLFDVSDHCPVVVDLVPSGP